MQKIVAKIAEVKSGNVDSTFSGYASVFNCIDSYGDVILPGAFKGSLSARVELLWQHNPAEPIGKVLELRETVKGLFIRAKLVLGIARAKEVNEMLKEGIIDGLSIGFEAEDFFYKEDNRYIKTAKLWEISLVTFPANDAARVIDVRSVDYKLTKALERARQAIG
jgi:uncharacterized protein